jgi:hypothetical protein
MMLDLHVTLWLLLAVAWCSTVDDPVILEAPRYAIDNAEHSSE